MDHNILIDGNTFSLRPVRFADSKFIVDIRRSDRASKYMHDGAKNEYEQDYWTRAYFKRPNDWYFIVERISNREAVGTISIYDVDEGTKTGEWGRWIIQPGSLAAIESALLIYKVAFSVLKLRGVFCRTVANNSSVVSFHDSSGAIRRRVLTNHVELRGTQYDSIEHAVDLDVWREMCPRLEQMSAKLDRIIQRNRNA
ncbi:GNAT family N-acetyltransferase [Shinella sp. S4-D37]|uniref:GNAT family N-acetyltransferase n=1 Tax=Shinella sp. S4-D37 TaxID=3161999 RepID=UPI003465431A